MKKTFKRILSLILAATMILGLLVFCASAEEVISGKCGENAVWEFNSSTRTMTISGTGDMYNWDVSLSGDTVPWSSIRHNISTVVIYDGITSVGRYAFALCSSLKTIVIPDSVSTIGEYAFESSAYYDDESNWVHISSENDTLDTLYIGKHLIKVKENFSGAFKFDDYVCMNTISIAESAFEECANLTQIVIPDGVKKINAFTFWYCSNLKSVSIPDTVTYVGQGAFQGCSKLEDVLFRGNEKQWNNVTVDVNNQQMTDVVRFMYVSVNLHKITWVVDGASTTDEYEAGEEIVVPSAPIKDGYVFKGWDKEIPSTMPENDLTFTAVFEKAIEEDIYNLGEETYSFENYGDNDSAGGHCFGMSMTSSAYYIGKLDINQIGVNDKSDLYTLSATEKVRGPICKYQAIQGGYSLDSTVAGGSYYKTFRSDINSDWNEVVNFVKTHEYDNKGMLQIGYRRNNQGGHAINFLRYEEVNGQPRIYAYDNNFPDVETYFYKDANGKIQQAPYSTFSGSIDCIALRSVSNYFSVVDNYDSTRYIYADRDAISVNGVDVYPIDGGVEMGERVVFEVPAGVEQVTITPLVNNAAFTYLENEYSFGTVEDDTVGIFTLALSDDKETYNSSLEIFNSSINIKNPSTTTISYGDSIILHTEALNVPDGGRVEWTANNACFKMNVSADGKTCTISPDSTGNTTFTATVYDAQGNAVSTDTQEMTSKAGFWQKIVAFFKGIFNLTKVFPW